MKDKVIYIVVGIVLLLVGLGCGFFLGKGPKQTLECTEALKDGKVPKFEDSISEEKKIDGEVAVSLNGSEHKIKLEMVDSEHDLDKIYFDGNLIVQKFMPGTVKDPAKVYYYVFKARDNNEYLVMGWNSYLSTSYEYLIGSNGKVLKEIDYFIEDVGMIMPKNDDRDRKLYAYVEDGYLYYPQYVGDRTLNDKDYTWVNIIKTDISDNKVINVGIEDTKLFFVSTIS
jgi:hypothetical protein